MKCKLLTLSALMLPMLALAHSGEGALGGFKSGFMHPILGWDHVAAMVAVGLWGAILLRPALWVLPITFPMVMAIGAVLGIVGIPVPYVETGIALSSLVLGALILIGWKAPLWAAMLVVSIFAIFHGHAHGTELPEAANPLTYAIGFVLGTGLLHLAGICLGFLDKLPKGLYIVRGLGGVIALCGVAFLMGWL
jgi:urease accessory protein